MRVRTENATRKLLRAIQATDRRESRRQVCYEPSRRRGEHGQPRSPTTTLHRPQKPTTMCAKREECSTQKNNKPQCAHHCPTVSVHPRTPSSDAWMRNNNQPCTNAAATRDKYRMYDAENKIHEQRVMPERKDCSPTCAAAKGRGRPALLSFETDAAHSLPADGPTAKSFLPARARLLRADWRELLDWRVLYVTCRL